MEVLIVSCIHNDIENMLNLFERLSALKFDLVICPGDFTNYVTPKGFTRIDVAKLIIEELKTLGKQILAVPGSWDKEIIAFLDEEKISIHGKGKIIDKIGFYGFGGARTPFNTPYEPEEVEIREGLKRAFGEIKNSEIKVQVTHMPPARTKVDIIFSGAHVGSETIRNFIEKNKPDVAISAHIHEARGIDELGKTKLINSGRFPEGYCGLISLKRKNISGKIINLT